MLGGAVMKIRTDFPDLMNRLEEKYPTTTEQDREEAITYAVTQYLKLTHEDTYDIQNLVFMDWIRRACFELLDRKYVLGVAGGVKHYSEKKVKTISITLLMSMENHIKLVGLSLIH